MIAARWLPSWQSLALILLPSLESEPKQSYRNSGLISMGIHGDAMGTHGVGEGQWRPMGTAWGPREDPAGTHGDPMGTHGGGHGDPWGHHKDPRRVPDCLLSDRTHAMLRFRPENLLIQERLSLAG